MRCPSRESRASSARRRDAAAPIFCRHQQGRRKKRHRSHRRPPCPTSRYPRSLRPLSRNPRTVSLLSLIPLDLRLPRLPLPSALESRLRLAKPLRSELQYFPPRLGHPPLSTEICRKASNLAQSPRPLPTTSLTTRQSARHVRSQATTAARSSSSFTQHLLVSRTNGPLLFLADRISPSDRPLLDDFEATTLRRVRSFIASAAPHLSEETLIDHYLSFIHPTLPVLPLSPLHPPDSLPPSLRASILVETLGYFPSLRDNGDYAWRLLKEEKLGERMLDRPKLSSLATAILELSTSMDPRGDYALLAKVRALRNISFDCADLCRTPDNSTRSASWVCDPLAVLTDSADLASPACTSTAGLGRSRTGRSRFGSGCGGACASMMHG